MNNKTLRSSLKAFCVEIMNEMSTSSGAGGYLTKKAFRKPTKKDIKSPTGFESSPKPNMYSKNMKFKIVQPKQRLNSKDLWEGKETIVCKKCGWSWDLSNGGDDPYTCHKCGTINEIKVNTPIIKAKLNSGDEDDILVYKKGVKYEDYKDEIDKSIDGDFTNKDKVTWSLISVPRWGNEKYWWNDEEIDFPGRMNESRYTQFKRSTSKPKPREILHRAIKEIQMKMDDVNRLIEFTTRIKGELQENDQEIEYLKRTKDSLYKIQDKLKEAFRNISKINEIKINNPTTHSLEDIKLLLKGKMLNLAGLFMKYFPGWGSGIKKVNENDAYKALSPQQKQAMYQDALKLSKGETIYEIKINKPDILKSKTITLYKSLKTPQNRQDLVDILEHWGWDIEYNLTDLEYIESLTDERKLQGIYNQMKKYFL